MGQLLALERTTNRIITTVTRTTTIITEVEGAEEGFLPAEVVDMVNTTKTATMEEEDTVEVVEGGIVVEAIIDSRASHKIITTWTMTTMVAVQREVETSSSKMKVAEMDRSNGIEMAEETSATMEGEEEDHMEEEVDTTKEAVVEDHGVGNSEEIIAEVAGTVIATKSYSNNEESFSRLCHHYA